MMRVILKERISLHLSVLEPLRSIILCMTELLNSECLVNTLYGYRSDNQKRLLKNMCDELDDNLHELITRYCEEGDRLFDDGLFDEALLEYDSAWGLLPEPKLKWDAAGWIYAAKGDAYFFKADYSNALPFFRGLYNQFDMINEFVLIRYVQCLYELGEIEKGKRFIFEAYMLGGQELFINENAKYFYLIEKMI